jgi:stalled ribosome rescue protein Dom34
MGPILKQSMRKTIPVIVFDDLNKIEQMNMLAEIVRFLKLVEEQAANIILVSSDEETWSRLRR